MTRKTPHTQVAVEVELVDKVKTVAIRNRRSIVSEVAVALTEYVERECARETDMVRG